MDFAFAPGKTSQDDRARAMFARRASTRLVPPARRRTSVRDFLLHVDTTHGADPVDNLLIAAHAEPEGWLGIPMFRGQRGVTQFETLEGAIATPAHSIEIPAGIMPANFHVKGCNLGKAIPFLQKLKEALGGNVRVTAPRHFHGMSIDRRRGVWEYLGYEFRLRRHPHDSLETRDEVIDAFDKEVFAYYDLTLIPLVQWEMWIPNRVDRSDQRKVPERLATPVGPRETIPVERQFRVQRRKFPWPPIPFPPGTVPGDLDERKAALFAAMRAHPRMSQDHDFPDWRRWQYDSIDQFMVGFDWRCHPAGNSLNCTGTRLDYVVLAAIRNRSAAARDTLISNFYPNDGSPHHTTTPALVETDLSFFVSV